MCCKTFSIPPLNPSLLVKGAGQPPSRDLTRLSSLTDATRKGRRGHAIFYYQNCSLTASEVFTIFATRDSSSPEVHGYLHTAEPRISEKPQHPLYQMDETNPQNSTGHSVSTLRSPMSVRQPVSCEPCRRRKIKCSRTRPPCDTCRRRGCADLCVYKGYKATRDEGYATALAVSNQELLDRISNLESLLREHTGAQIPAAAGEMTSSMISPPVEPIQPSQLRPEAFTPDTCSPLSYQPERLASRGIGVLTSSPNGDVRYEPRSSQWSSVLANTGLSIETASLDAQNDSETTLGFPFATTGISTFDELLALLPPMRQCDYLVNTYFTVFSPASIPVVLSSHQNI